MNTDDKLYRVNIHYDTKQVHVESFGINVVDLTVKLGHYDSVDDLPMWMQERLSVLNMLECPPPPNDVEGVGCRIGPYIYWVSPE